MATKNIADTDTAESFEFTGRRWPFFRLLVVNLLLTILTLGIYRFWAKTRVRKFIWSNIRFMGDPLEYTGKASELFLGFLIVLAVLFPLGLIYNAISFLVPPDELWLRIGLEVIYYLVILALIQIGFYKAWRYRMSRTAWRGIRLGLDGSTLDYLKLSAGWTVLTLITLGVAYPWMQIELWRYQITHTRIGETATTFTGSGRDLFSSWVLVLIPMVIGMASFIAVPLLHGAQVDTTNWSLPKENHFGFAALISIASVSYLFALICGFWFGIKFARYQISGMSLSNTSATSRLPFGRLFGFALLAMLVFISLAGVLGGGLVTTVVGADFAVSNFNFSIFLPLLLIMFVFMVFPIAWTLFYQFELIKQLFITTTVTNPEALEGVVQSAAALQKTGEGLADALDIGGL